MSHIPSRNANTRHSLARPASRLLLRITLDQTDRRTGPKRPDIAPIPSRREQPRTFFLLPQSLRKGDKADEGGAGGVEVAFVLGEHGGKAALHAARGRGGLRAVLGLGETEHADLVVEGDVRQDLSRLDLPLLDAFIEGS